MEKAPRVSKTISLESLGILNSDVRYQLSPKELQQIAVAENQGITTNSGALAINTGDFTGRSPKDRFIVMDDITRDQIWWGKVNIPFDTDKFEGLRQKMVRYLSDKTLYARDCFACAELSYRKSVRVVTELPWSSMFVYNMFIRPSEDV